MEVLFAVIVVAFVVGYGISAIINFFLPKKYTQYSAHRQPTIREGSLK